MPLKKLYSLRKFPHQKKSRPAPWWRWVALVPLLLALAACGEEALPALDDLVIGEVQIEQLEIQLLPGSPPETRVVARGNLGDNCTMIAQANVEQDENTFKLSLSTETTGAADCQEGIYPFEQTISLPVSDLPPGTYEVVLANLQQTFNIAEPIAAAPAQEDTPPAETEAAPTEAAPTEPAPPQPEEAPAAALAGITGLVWHDLCGAAAEDSSITTGNCTETLSGLRANGTADPGEPGLDGVEVQLGAGACPASGLATTTTDSGGRFTFSNLESGTYCVSVNPDITPNQALLQPGAWTAPGANEGQATIELPAEGEVQLDFGWDFDRLPVVESPTCLDKAAFFEDVTIPDNTVLRPGSTFIKTWKLRNEGTCTWGPDYAVVLADGNPLGAPTTSPLSPIEPDKVFEFSLEMTAPTEPGEYVANYQFRNPQGTDFGVGVKGTDFFWVLINISWFPEPGETSKTPAPEPTPTQPPPTTTGACAVDFDPGFESQVLELINNARAAQGLSTLQSQGQLTEAARAHSTDMACGDFFGHNGSDGSTWFERIAAQGYSYSYATENIYVGNPAFGGTPAGAFKWWMDSEVHRNNILDPQVTQIGVGYVFLSSSSYGGYYTLVFATP